ncbi:MAG: V-type ATP synthase subunit A [Thaumarchaeota archaeon]|nr:MAG: V-type ATP synthase subunit A [Nitrososphaerota archaeon]
MVERRGRIEWIGGSVVIASGMAGVKVGEVVEVGEEGLIGEVIRLKGEEATIQVYENTAGLKPGEPVVSTGRPLRAELGPGLLNNIFDGIGRPLERIMEEVGPFFTRGVKIPTLDRAKKWHFKPVVKKGDKLGPGDIIGSVQETPTIEHKIMVPPDLKGVVTEIYEGDFTVTDTVCVLDTPDKGKVELKIMQEWPVRVPRPYRVRLPSTEPLITGQRVIDTFFPVAKGGAAAIPGGFGTGKTVMLHQLAKWSDADVVIYVGCGERGNEMCDALTHFPKLTDPRTGKPLMYRTILIANVSNMPVAAREASIYIGITYAEYFRDMGYHVCLVADSTSRWAEALREISGRLEEMPAERGYPAYLPDRIAGFYERAGRVVTLGRPERIGSVTVVGAVSPPGGDFNEPVTQHTMRFIGTFWALDKDLAFSRHFPAIHWLKSYSRYVDTLKRWWSARFKEWEVYRARALKLLEEASKIEETARIIGESALPDEQRLVLLAAELIKEGFLVQSAFHPIDTFCPPEKQVYMLKVLIEFYEKAERLVKAEVPYVKIRDLPAIPLLERMKEKSKAEEIAEIEREAITQLEKLAEEYGVKI